MSRVLAMPNFEADIKGRVFVDVMNEPDSMGIRWEPSNGKPGAAELYLTAMDAMHELSPDGWLYVVEGTGQNSFGLNWVSRSVPKAVGCLQTDAPHVRLSLALLLAAGQRLHHRLQHHFQVRLE